MVDDIQVDDTVYVFKVESTGIVIRIDPDRSAALIEFEDGERRWYSIGTMFKVTKDASDG